LLVLFVWAKSIVGSNMMNRGKTATIFDVDSFTCIMKLCLRTAIYSYQKTQNFSTM